VSLFEIRPRLHHILQIFISTVVVGEQLFVMSALRRAVAQRRGSSREAENR
jgi:hypothetical protein